ncbi:MAG: hypothetical protein ACERKZ_20660 [Lachnotalea sp.]
METQNIQNNNGTVPEQQQEKTFTQEQVNAIVGKRLAEQKATNDQELIKRESELKQKEMSLKAKELLQEKGLPKELAEVLRYDNEESLVKAIETIEHTRGLNQNNNQADLAGEKQIQEHKLEMGSEYGNPDPVKDAFKLKG